MMTKALIASSLAVALVAGCSSTYVPRRHQSLRLVIEAGVPSVVKNGRLYPVGLLGGGLVDATEDNPRAVEHAEAFHSGMTWGVVGYVAGLVGIVASPVALEAARNDNDRVALFGGLLLGGLAVSMLGVASMVSAQPRMYDAINVYNDDILFGPPPAAESLPPPASPTALER